MALGAERGRSVALEDADEILFGNSSSSIVARVDVMVAETAPSSTSEDVAETLDIAKSLHAAEPAMLSTLSEGLERDALLAVHRFTQQATGVRDIGRLLDHFGASALDALPAVDRMTTGRSSRAIDGDTWLPNRCRARSGNWSAIAVGPYSSQ